MNDDLISRKEAIDEVKRLHDVAWANWKETRISANTMIYALKDLPSAHPEIIHCRDCKHHWTYRCMGDFPTEACELEQTFYDANVDFCSLAERRTDG